MSLLPKQNAKPPKTGLMARQIKIVISETTLKYNTVDYMSESPADDNDMCMRNGLQNRYHPI